jgi:hypothetical protein
MFAPDFLTLGSVVASSVAVASALVKLFFSRHSSAKRRITIKSGDSATIELNTGNLSPEEIQQLIALLSRGPQAQKGTTSAAQEKEQD